MHVKTKEQFNKKQMVNSRREGRRAGSSEGQCKQVHATAAEYGNTLRIRNVDTHSHTHTHMHNSLGLFIKSTNNGMTEGGEGIGLSIQKGRGSAVTKT